MASTPSIEHTAQIRALFDAVVELAPDARAAYLDRACGEAPELRREVDALLGVFTHVDEILRPYEEPLRPPALSPGWTGRLVSHYHVLEKLGGGGMGVVYKARDLTLDRLVALKVLPPQLSLDAEAKRRFLHEAKAASVLDHVNICTIYEVGETDDGRLFLVMAYVEGKTLKARIARGPLPLDRALDVAVQMAQGLAAAHAQGTIHRDVKPANVMLTSEGTVRLVDFGLAKLAGASSLTQAGMTLGTVAYMSPEQLRGEAVDPRTDIWSLGVVLYEMVAGRRPFRGDHVETLAQAIWHAEPAPLTGLRTDVPRALEGVVAKCLAKAPQERYQHVEEVPVDLRALERRPSAVSRRLEARGRWVRGAAWSLVGALVLGAVLVLWRPWARPSPLAPAPVRFTVQAPQGETLSYLSSSIAISPDGRLLVYAGMRDDRRRLYLRPLDALEATPIPGTEGGSAPFFSPDGAWLGFVDGFDEGRNIPPAIKKVSLRGGAPQTIIARGLSGGAVWGEDDMIYFAGAFEPQLWRVPAAGGTPEHLTEPGGFTIEEPEQQHGRPEALYHLPEVLPGGKAILYTVWNSVQDVNVKVRILDTGEERILLDPGTDARYVPTGHLLYAWAGNLMAAPFDLETLEVTGPHVTVVEGVLVNRGGDAFYSVSDAGILVYIPVAEKGTSPGVPWSGRLVWVDHDGRQEPPPIAPGEYRGMSLSPDGTRLLAHRPRSQGSVWLYDLEREAGRPLTEGGAIEKCPLWTPDGRGIFYSSNRDGGPVLNLYFRPLDESTPPRRLVESRYTQCPLTWSADGTTLLYTENRLGDTWGDIMQIDLEGDGPPQPVVQTPAGEGHPAISPDGRWLAYASTVSEEVEVYVQPYPGPGRITPVSTAGGSQPLWAPDGRTLYYIQHQYHYRNGQQVMTGQKVMAVPFEPGPELRLGTPRLVFEGSYFVNALAMMRNYALSPDGTRFLMLHNPEMPPPPTQLVVITNWFEELNRLVPTDT